MDAIERGGSGNIERVDLAALPPGSIVKALTNHKEVITLIPTCHRVLMENGAVWGMVVLSSSGMLYDINTLHTDQYIHAGQPLQLHVLASVRGNEKFDTFLVEKIEVIPKGFESA